MAAKADVLLDSPDKGLIVEHYMWREMIWGEKDSVLCVAADSYYDESDYIRDYDEFLEAVKGKDLTDAVDGTPLTPRRTRPSGDRFVMHESGNGTLLQTRNF